MRDKLIKLIQEAGEKYLQDPSGGISTSNIVDYLVDNGVTVVSCGKWLTYDSGLGWWVDAKCSNCGYTDCFDKNSFYTYCPECGARMDGDNNENNL